MASAREAKAKHQDELAVLHQKIYQEVHNLSQPHYIKYLLCSRFITQEARRACTRMQNQK